MRYYTLTEEKVWQLNELGFVFKWNGCKGCGNWDDIKNNNTAVGGQQHDATRARAEVGAMAMAG